MNGFRAWIAVLLPLFGAVAASAATVTTLEDSVPGSLRQAIIDASPGETIDFAVTGTIVLTDGPLVITRDVTLQGPGAGSLSVSGGNLDRVMTISGASATVSGLTITSGFFRGDGGGVHVDVDASFVAASCVFVLNRAIGERGSPFLEFRGGGIFNAGTTQITDCTFDSNNAWGADFGSYASNLNGLGGAVYNDATGSLTVSGSTFHLNSADGSSSGNMSGGNGSGGAIDNAGTAAITNSTFNLNVARGGDSPLSEPGDGEGGAIFNSGTLALTNCTASGNQARPGVGGEGLAGAARGGAVVNAAGNATLKQVILAGNSTFDTSGFPSPSDCFGDFTSAGHNLIGIDSGCNGFTDGVGGDQVGSSGTPGPFPMPLDPLLGPLTDNGGPTETEALLPGSTAIDAGEGTDCPATDQRGAPRPADGDGDGLAICDIGAYEVQPESTSTPTPSETPTATEMATETPTPLATDTPSVSPSDTPTATEMATETPTPVATDTPSVSPSDTPPATEMATETPTPLATPSPVPTYTSTASPSDTPTQVATDTPTDTPMPIPTETPTTAPTETPVSVSTSTPTSQPPPATPTQTAPPTETATVSPAPGGGEGCDLTAGPQGGSSAPTWLLAPLLLVLWRRRRIAAGKGSLLQDGRRRG